MADRIFVAGNQLTVDFDNVDYSTLSQACDLDANRDAMELKRCGGAAVARLTGAVASTYKWKMWWDPIVAQALTAKSMEANATAVTLIVKGAGAAGQTETSSVFVNKVSRKSTPDKPVELEVELLVDGAVTYA